MHSISSSVSIQPHLSRIKSLQAPSQRQCLPVAPAASGGGLGPPHPAKPSPSPAATAPRSADSGTHCWASYQTLLHICKNTMLVKTNSTPWEPPASALQMDLLFPVWPEEPPQPLRSCTLLSGTCSFCQQEKKWHLTCFELEWLQIFPKTAHLYRERSHPKMIQFRFDFCDLYHRRQTSHRRQGEVDCPNCSTYSQLIYSLTTWF